MKTRGAHIVLLAPSLTELNVFLPQHSRRLLIVSCPRSPCLWNWCHWFISCPAFPLSNAMPWKSWSAWGLMGSSLQVIPLLTPAAPLLWEQLPEHLFSPPSPAPPHSSPPRLGQPLLKGLPGSPSSCHYDANRVVNFSEMLKESPNLF